MRPSSLATLLACATTLVAPLLHAQSTLHLIPIPRQLVQLPDVSLSSGVTVVCSACNAEDTFAADDLRQTLTSRGIATGIGLHIVLDRLAQHPDPAFTAEMRPEGYTAHYADKTLTLTGDTAAGLFYAAQTAKQLIESTPSGVVLHAADIHDWPAMQYRGLHDDLSRGPVDTLDFQKHLIRTLAAYKVNLYSPYFENTQQYASNPLPAPPDGSISASDARELVAYAAQYHIMIVPEQEAFGHLRKMLTWETYADLAETPHGAVLSPSQPGTIPLIDQMFTELAALYPSPFLHIGGDETIDLGIGRTKPDVDTRGLAPVYLDFLQHIVTSLQPLHRKILFWGDVAQDSPDLLKALPPSIKDQLIAVAWGYTPKPNGFAAYLKPYTQAGIQTWVAPAINNYRQVWPNQQLALDDIQQFTRDGQRFGATGQLNTLWNDDGESLANMNWYGILFGAASAWQSGESSIPAFEQSYAQVFHGDSSGLLNQAQSELTAAMTLLHDTKVISNTEGTDGLFWVDPYSKDGQIMADKMRPINSAVRLYAEHALTYIAQAKALNPPTTPIEVQTRYPEPSGSGLIASQNNSSRGFSLGSAATTSLREPDAIAAMDFGARRIDFLCLKFQLADEISDAWALAQITAQLPPPTHGEPRPKPSVSALLSDINGVNGRLQDIIDTYSQLRDMYAQQWNLTYRPSGLRPVLEHYDYTIAQWYARVDKVRSAQRQWSETKTLPPSTDLNIPAPPPTQPTPTPSTPTAPATPAPATPTRTSP